MYHYMLTDKKNNGEGIQMVLLEELENHEYVTLKNYINKSI